MALNCSAHQYACARLSQALVGAAPFSKVAWVKLNSYPLVDQRQYGIISTDNPTSNSYYHRLTVKDETNLKGMVCGRTRNTTTYLGSHTTSIMLGKWVHAGATWEIDGSNTRIRPYHNGGESPEGNVTYSTATPTGLAETVLGNEAFNLLQTGRNLDGLLAHAAIYSVKLTADDFTNLQSLPPSKVQAVNLVAYWPGSLVNISGSDYLEDASGNGYHALLENQAAWSAEEPPNYGGPTPGRRWTVRAG